MATKTISVVAKEGYRDGAHEAAAVLDNGGLVVFPTETVYGVAARADHPDALVRLQRAKQRSADKPFTVHIGRRSDAERYVRDLDPVARRFVKKAWPGPLTLLVPTENPADAPIAAEIDEAALKAIYRENTVGLRCPDNAVAGELLRQTQGPVVAASANLAGQKPPRTVAEALMGLNGLVDLALDGGPARYSRPSTIIRITAGRYQVLRDGVYDNRMLSGFAMLNLLFVCTGNTCRSPMAEAIAERLIAERVGCAVDALSEHNVAVVSAGTFAGSGGTASDHAVAVLAEQGIDISSHRSQPLTTELINQADYIFGMTASHRSLIVEMVRSAEDRTKRLLENEDISDPIGGTYQVYAECAETIEKAIKDRLTEVEL